MNRFILRPSQNQAHEVGIGCNIRTWSLYNDFP